MKRAGNRARTLASRAPTVLVVLGFLLLVPATPSTAVGSSAGIRVHPRFAPPTTPIEVAGRSFESGETVDILFDGADVAQAVADPSGGFVVSITVPATASPGRHAVEAVGETSGERAQARFTVSTDWPRYHFDLGNTGFNPYENELTAANASLLQQAWSRAGDSYQEGSPVVAGGRLYIVSHYGQVTALNVNTGAVVFRVRTGGIESDSTPDVADGVVYIASRSGNVIALDGKTGATLWTTHLDTVYSEPTTVWDGLVFVTTSPGLAALNTATGQVVWQRTDLYFLSAPAVANGSLYALSDKLYALDPETGTTKWTSDLSGANPLVVGGGIVYSADAGGGVWAVDGEGGDRLWHRQVGHTIQTAPVLAGGLLYVSTDDTLWAMDALTGGAVWARRDFDYASFPGLAAAGGVVYLGANDGMHAYDAATGKPLWRSPLSDQIYSSPLVSNGTLYFAYYISGRVEAFRPASLRR